MVFPHFYVRNERFKLVLPHLGRTYVGFLPGGDGRPGAVNNRHQETLALFDLHRDPGERYNVYSMYPDVVAQLMKIVEAARADLGDDLTGHNGTGRRPIGE